MADHRPENASTTRSLGRRTRAPIFLLVVAVALFVAFLMR